MKNQINKIISIISALMLCLIAFNFKVSKESTFANFNGSAVNASNSAVLVYNPTTIASNANNLFVYDQYDSLIKIYDKSTLNLVEQNNTIYYENVIKLAVIDNFLFILSNLPAKLDVIDTTTNSSISIISEDNISSLSQVNNFEVYKTSETNITVVLSKFVDGQNYFEIFNFQNDGANWNFAEESATINKERGLNLPTKINDFYICPTLDESKFNLVFLSENSIYYLVFSPLSQPSTSYVINNLGLSIIESVTAIERLILNDNSFLIVLTESSIKVYLESISNDFKVTEEFTTIEQTLLNATNFTSFNDCLYASIPNEQKVMCFNLQGEHLNYNFNIYDIVKNEDLNTTMLRNQEFNYYITTSASQMTASPFSQTSICEIPQGANVCQIATSNLGQAELTEFIYCVYTSNNLNYYGFIKSLNLRALPSSTYNQEKVKVYSGSNLYSLPTILIDKTNTKLLTFEQVTTLTVIANDVNNNYIAGANKFILVQTEDGKIGFVEASKTLASTEIREMITNNATIKKDTNVYLEPNSDSDIIDTLEKGQRIKIESNQKTNSKYLKITYNNKNGEEITGYVLADHVTRDTWTVLQIIGLIFVALNVIFLIVLLFVKKKINND